MKKLLPFALLILTTSQFASAKSIDIESMNCKQYFGAIKKLSSGDNGKAKTSAFMAFLYGHAAGQSKSSLYSGEEFKSVFMKVNASCKSKSTQKLSDVLMASYTQSRN